MKNKKILGRLARGYLCVIVLAVAGYRHRGTVDILVHIIESKMGLCVIAVLVAYAVKGMVMVIPLPRLNIAVSLLFGNSLAAILANLAGTAVSLSVGWFNGRAISPGDNIRLVEKYPKLKRIREFEAQNAALFSCTVRVIGGLPFDVVSLYCGAKGVPYKEYIIGSLIGVLPGVVSNSIIGANLTDPLSPGFVLAVIFKIRVFVYTLSAVKKFRQNAGG